MARKQFVSSKKNAPSRVVSSKEAALHARDPTSGDDDLDSNSEQEDSVHDGGGGDSPKSPMSSAPSSPVSSDDDGGEDDDPEDDDDDENRVNPAADSDDGEEDPAAAAAVVSVQVVPASVGSGKQLRFPTAISRGKEARTLPNGPERDGSDSESYASLASDDEEEAPSSVEENDTQPGLSEPMDVTTTTTTTTATTTTAVKVSPPRPRVAAKDVEEEEEKEIVYPIKSFRARKRHRPDSGYYKQMSTHVRDCLLSVRDSASAAEVFREENHHEFRRKLSSGTVERVQWKEASPPPAAATSSESEKKPPKKTSSSSDPNLNQRDKVAKEPRVKKEPEEVGSTKTSVSGSRAKSDDRSVGKETTATDSIGSTSSRKRERSSGDSDEPTGSRQEKISARTGEPLKREPVDTSRSNGSGPTSASSAKTENSSKDPEKVLCAKCKNSIHPHANADQTTGSAAASSAPAASANPPPVVQQPGISGSFTVPPGPIRDVTQLRAMAARLMDEARTLKHEGNRQGKAEPGPVGQVAQGRYFLRSSAKFFQHALLFADMKAAYKDLGDERQARTNGEYCLRTLGQTSSLIESTIGTLHSAGNKRLVALGYKMSSIVHLTIYRLQHLKLFSLYSDLFTPGRSPDSRASGNTPPTSSSGSDTQDAAVRTLLIKEMEHTLRGFEMWRRYENCRIEVLPRITNPAVIDLDVLLEDLLTELNRP